MTDFSPLPDYSAETETCWLARRTDAPVVRDLPQRHLARERPPGTQAHLVGQ